MEQLQDFYPIVYDIIPNTNSTTNTNTNIRLLKNISEFWQENKDFWFSHKPINSWDLEPPINYTNTLDINFRLLLHYDQIYRHPNPLILENNKKLAYKFATHIALKIIHNQQQFAKTNDIEKVFILLTLRHNKSLLMKELVLKKVLEITEYNHTPIFMRFLKATIWDIHEFKHKEGYSPEIFLNETHNMYSSYISYPWKHILQEPNIIPDFNISSIYKKLYTDFFNIISSQNNQIIAVSISGGVDSMVAAKISKEVCHALNKKLILLHINYNNRDCCEEECDLLRDFAQKLCIPLYIRKITEIQRVRHTHLREIYEDITRKIRFSFYSYFKCPVILGHNQDDCFENVFQNLSKQIHFDNLFGMRQISEEQGVPILRPMLNVCKKDIYLYADHSGIPHLYDSTPDWSRRGQMRDKLIPGIQTFDPLILPGLKEFINRSIFLEQQWRSSFEEYTKKIIYQDYRIILPRDHFFNSNFNSLNFWITLWHSLEKRETDRQETDRQETEKQKEIRPSNKSFQNLIQQLQTRAKVCGLNLNWKVLIKSDILILIKY